MYLLTEIWNQKLLIENVLNEEDDEVATLSKGKECLGTLIHGRRLVSPSIINVMVVKKRYFILRGCWTVSFREAAMCKR